jgi:hypothetical protein
MSINLPCRYRYRIGSSEDRFIAWGVNPPTAANRGRGRGSPAIGHSLATVRHDGRRPSVTPGTPSTPSSSPGGATDFCLRREPQVLAFDCLSPLRGLSIIGSIQTLGLTPQAMSISPLRGLPVSAFFQTIGIMPQGQCVPPRVQGCLSLGNTVESAESPQHRTRQSPAALVGYRALKEHREVGALAPSNSEG